MSAHLDALHAIFKAARLRRGPNRRMEYIEEVAAAAIEGRACTADLNRPTRGDTVRHMARQIIDRTEAAGRLAVIGWLREGRVPADPQDDPLERLVHVPPHLDGAES